MDTLEKDQTEEYQNNTSQNATNNMSVKDWLITMLILVIPIVNIVMLFIWAFGNPDPRRNYARASLIWSAIVIGLLIIFYGALIAFIIAVSSTS